MDRGYVQGRAIVPGAQTASACHDRSEREGIAIGTPLNGLTACAAKGSSASSLHEP